jgi:hypothetical protein
MGLGAAGRVAPVKSSIRSADLAPLATRLSADEVFDDEIENAANPP